jgi:hypothetical protein
MEIRLQTVGVPTRLHKEHDIIVGHEVVHALKEDR